MIHNFVGILSLLIIGTRSVPTVKIFEEKEVKNNEKTHHKLNLDERKYDALHTFSTQKGIDIDAEFVAYFEKMYKKIVPKAVREYIEGTTLSTVSDPVSEKKVIHNDPQLQPEPEPETKSNPISNPGGFWS